LADSVVLVVEALVLVEALVVESSLVVETSLVLEVAVETVVVERLAVVAAAATVGGATKETAKEPADIEIIIEINLGKLTLRKLTYVLLQVNVCSHLVPG